MKNYEENEKDNEKEKGNENENEKEMQLRANGAQATAFGGYGALAPSCPPTLLQAAVCHAGRQKG